MQSVHNPISLIIDSSTPLIWSQICVNSLPSHFCGGVGLQYHPPNIQQGRNHRSRPAESLIRMLREKKINYSADFFKWDKAIVLLSSGLLCWHISKKLDTSQPRVPQELSYWAFPPYPSNVTLWLCQNSYWTWPFIVDITHWKLWFSIVMLVYQRVVEVT